MNARSQALRVERERQTRLAARGRAISAARRLQRAIREACAGMLQYTDKRQLWMIAQASRRPILKHVASRLGIPFEEYRARMLAGEKWCTGCRAFHERAVFGFDAWRSDLLRPVCRATENRAWYARKRRAA